MFFNTTIHQLNNWTMYVNITWTPMKHQRICFENTFVERVSKYVCISRNWQEKSTTARVDSDLIWILHPVLFLAGTRHPSVNKSLGPKGPGTRTRRICHVATFSFQETICVSTELWSFSARTTIYRLAAGPVFPRSKQMLSTTTRKKKKKKETLRHDLVTPSRRIDLLSPPVLSVSFVT